MKPLEQNSSQALMCNRVDCFQSSFVWARVRRVTTTYVRDDRKNVSVFYDAPIARLSHMFRILTSLIYKNTSHHHTNIMILRCNLAISMFHIDSVVVSFFTINFFMPSPLCLKKVFYYVLETQVEIWFTTFVQYCQQLS